MATTATTATVGIDDTDLEDEVEGPERDETLSTKEAWAAAMAEEPPDRPDRLPVSAYESLDDAGRDAYDSARLVWNETLPTITTPTLAAALSATRRVMRSNSTVRYGRRGIAVSGEATSGKTTMVSEVGRWAWEAAVRRRPDGTPEAVHVPVAYISVPSGCTPKQLDQELCYFYGLPTSRGANAAELTEKVRKVIRRCGTELVIVDEAHLLAASRVGQGPTDHLKNLANGTSATWLYAGVGLTTGPLFKGDRAEQTAGRFQAFNLGSMGYDTPQQEADWAAMVKAFEDHFVLLDHKTGTLSGRLAGYLYARTQGRISSLAGLLKDAAEEAVMSASERIDYWLLESILTDVLSQRAWENDKAARAKWAKKFAGTAAAA